ncbi:MAG: lipoate--protein ligase family protein [Acidimicrobiales bacterium]
MSRPSHDQARSVRVCQFNGAALVLGSSQPEANVDRGRAQAAHVEVARRHSGGGAVLLEPGRALWLEVFVPAGDSLHHLDVGRAFWWLGYVWAEALGSLGVPDPVVHRSALMTTRWSRWACFAGLGPGEITVQGRKVVGISQRRTRAGSLFQCAVLVDFDPSATAGVLRMGEVDRADLVRQLSGFAAGVGAWADGDSVLRGFLSALATAKSD